MRAIVVNQFGPIDTHRIEELPDPEINADQVLVRVSACAVNFPDVLVIQGKYQFRPPLPFTPGKELVGEVVRVGSKAQSLKLGDRVLAQVEYGAFAELVPVNAAHCHRVPAGLDDADVAAMGMVYQTAYFALFERAQFRAGDSVLVTGAVGGVGSAAVQLAKAAGGYVLAGVSGAAQAEIARKNGADETVDLSLPDLKESLRDQVHALTNGRGVDIVIDPLGDKIFEASLRALAWCGRAVVIGFAAGEIPTLKTNYLLLKNIGVLGLQWSDYRDRQPEKVSEVQDKLFELLKSGKIKSNLAQVVSLDQFQSAFQIIASGQAVGKYVLKF